MAFPPHPRRAAGFTMLELLVAVVVLALLVLMAAQILGSGAAVIGASRKNLGADAQAREVFGRFAGDVAQMVKRPDMDAVFSDQAGNKKIFFYSEAPGFVSSLTNQSTVSLIGYRVGTNAHLERLGKALAWDGLGGATFLTYTNSSSTNPMANSTLAGSWGAVVGSAPAYQGIDLDYHTLAPGVFRFEYCFQKKDGTYTLTRDPKKGFSDVAAIVLSIAVLDGDSLKIIPDTSQLAPSLPSPNATDLAGNVLAAELWQAIVNNNAAFSTAAGIPQTAASRVRIYQRAFPLHMP